MQWFRSPTIVRATIDAEGGAGAAGGGDGAALAPAASGAAAGSLLDAPVGAGAAAPAPAPAGAPSAAPRQPIDEIREYQETRYIGVSEACTRAFGYDIHRRFPSVLKLALHLEGQHPVYFREGDEDEAREAGPKGTTLTAFLRLAAAEPDCKQPPVADLIYSDAPKFFTWLKTDRVWKRRANVAPDGCTPRQLGRVNNVRPSTGDVFYLRLLLHRVKGPKSFVELRTVDGTVHPTYREACLARGMLAEEGGVWTTIMDEAAEEFMPYQIRALFAQLIMFGSPPNVPALFEHSYPSMAEDVTYRLEARMAAGLDMDVRDNDVRRYVIQMIDQALMDRGTTLQAQGVPMPASSVGADGHPVRLFGVPLAGEAAGAAPADVGAGLTSLQRQLAHEVPRDKAAQLEYATSRVASLVPSQAAVYHAVKDAVDSGQVGRRIFLMAPGGCGKTYFAAMVLAYCRSKGYAALAVASSGVAANLLPLGRTAHSRFRIPIDIEGSSTCDFEARSDTAQLLKQTRLIVWDEATMAHRHCFEAVERTIRDAAGTAAARRITWLVCGDFRQIPPVVRKGTIAQTVRASFRKSRMWRRFQKMELPENMRVNNCLSEGNVQDAALLGTWAKSLLALGKAEIKSASELRMEEAAARANEEDEEEEAVPVGDDLSRMEADLRAALPPFGRVPPRQRATGNVPGGPSVPATFRTRAEELVTTAVRIPRALCQPASKGLKDLLLATFPDVATVEATKPAECMAKLGGRMVLTVLNKDVAEINREALALFPGEAKESISGNNLVHGEDGDWHDLATPEFMDAVDHSSIPDHVLKLKVGMPIMLLRNLSAQTGDCNGTRYIATKIGRDTLGARAVSDGRDVIIPKLFLTPADCGIPFNRKRFQFPVRAAFGATINKAQGTTLERLGVWLRDHVFGHGQLYVALSRVGDPRRVLVGALEGAYDATGCIVTSNVVYKQLVRDETV